MMSSHISVSRDLSPIGAAGIWRSIRAHCSSVRSLGLTVGCHTPSTPLELPMFLLWDGLLATWLGHRPAAKTVWNCFGAMGRAFVGRESANSLRGRRTLTGGRPATLRQHG